MTEPSPITMLAIATAVATPDPDGVEFDTLDNVTLSIYPGHGEPVAAVQVELPAGSVPHRQAYRVTFTPTDEWSHRNPDDET